MEHSGDNTLALGRLSSWVLACGASDVMGDMVVKALVRTARGMAGIPGLARAKTDRSSGIIDEESFVLRMTGTTAQGGGVEISPPRRPRPPHDSATWTR